LDPETVPVIEKGFAEFNAGKFFECHDTLEDVWREQRGPSRDFLQGLIQISVAFYHLQNGNLVGGQSQLEKALENLSGYGESYAGMDLANLRDELQSWLDKIRNRQDLHCAVSELPKFHWTDPTDRSDPSDAIG
jgi:predicted metal-dependent hydrolase